MAHPKSERQLREDTIAVLARVQVARAVLKEAIGIADTVSSHVAAKLALAFDEATAAENMLYERLNEIETGE